MHHFCIHARQKGYFCQVYMFLMDFAGLPPPLSRSLLFEVLDQLVVVLQLEVLVL